MEKDNQFVTSIAPADRIVSVDLLRGTAVLGILIMNIQSLSMIGAAYINPAAYGDLSGINKWVWILSHVLASEKFMSIFSILFGAGMLLFISKAIQKGHKAGPLHYRRMLWLFIFGMIHAYLIWYGDVLVNYSLCAMFVFVFRNQKPKTLVFISLAFFIVPVLMSLMSYYTIPFWPKESYDNSLQSWLPGADKVQSELAAMRGSWIEQMKIRVTSSIFMQTFLFFWMTFWRVNSMMLLGMAFLKWGILSSEKSKGFYFRMILGGLIPGYFLSAYGVSENFSAGWTMDYSMFIGGQFNYIGSVGVAIGYIGIIMLIAKMAGCVWFKKTFSAVGKMAFTNYILMSLICMFIFYGNGFGLFGHVERLQQLYFVIPIWILILIISTEWLKYFNFGPLEWLWRVLTYWKYQPFRKPDNVIG